jgi:hypothetical protein
MDDVDVLLLYAHLLVCQSLTQVDLLGRKEVGMVWSAIEETLHKNRRPRITLPSDESLVRCLVLFSSLSLSLNVNRVVVEAR